MKALSALILAVSMVAAPNYGFAAFSLQCDLVGDSTVQQDILPKYQTNDFVSSLNSATEWNHLADEVLHRLGGDDLRAFFGFNPRLSISEALLPNAYALDNDEVIISSGLLANIASQTEFAFVLAHELGHLVLGHTHQNLSNLTNSARLSNDIHNELEADKFALQLMSASGFNAGEVLPFLARLQSFGHEKGRPLGEIFPSIQHRIAAISLLESGSQVL